METLLTYPYVVVRLACRFCPRAGAYRLVRLAEKYGADASIDDVMMRLASDCPHWKRNSPWPKAAVPICLTSRTRGDRRTSR